MAYNCARCQITVETTFGSGKFCSRACSNSRSHSNITKERMRNTAKKNQPRNRIELSCNNCGGSIWVCKSKSGNKRNLCSSECRIEYFKKHEYITPTGKHSLRETAIANPKLGGNKNTRAWGWYTSVFAGRVWLESSYEHKVAEELDRAGVVWTRPKFLRYDDRRYFPDFYLVEHDVYLDPKNDHLIEKDRAKLEKVREQNQVKLLVLNKTQLEWETIKTLL